jgi:hypothetical protein
MVSEAFLKGLGPLWRSFAIRGLEALSVGLLSRTPTATNNTDGRPIQDSASETALARTVDWFVAAPRKVAAGR